MDAFSNRGQTGGGSARGATAAPFGIIEPVAAIEPAAIVPSNDAERVTQLEASLNVSRSAFESIVEHSTDGIVVLTETRQVAYVNPTAAALLESPRVELYGRRFWVDMDPGETVEFEFAGVHGRRSLECCLSDTVWQGQPAFLMTVRDITRRKWSTIEQVRREVRRRDEFLALLSHEIRNPLSAVSAAAEVILRGGRLSDLADAARVIGRQAQFLTRLLDDLLNLSGASLGKIRLQSAALELQPILLAAVDSVREELEHAGHRLEVRLAAEPVVILGDAVRIQQIVTNLLTNAGKYTVQPGSIVLTLAVADEQVVITVTDSGVGLAAEDLERIFDPFVQVDQRKHGAPRGMGLGLALVRYLANLHGGTSTASSAGPGKGSEFAIHLPRYAAATAAKPSEPVSAPRAHGRIVIIEDQPDVREPLEMLLQLEGFDVKGAGEGHSGLDLICHWQPDAALIDIGLPGLSGYEVARQVRQANLERQPFLVALTGYGQREDIQDAHQAGFDHHMTKPIRIEALLSVLSNRLAGRETGMFAVAQPLEAQPAAVRDGSESPLRLQRVDRPSGVDFSVVADSAVNLNS